jgi:hypothetical protein
MVRTRPDRRHADAISIQRSATPGSDMLRVTVFTFLTRYTIPVRRSGGCLCTAWYQPMCVMVRTRPDRRHAGAISIQRSATPGARHAPRNGFYVPDVVYNTRSSIRRVSEHRMVPANVFDGQDPARSTLYGRDIDTSPHASLGFIRCE